MSAYSIQRSRPRCRRCGRPAGYDVFNRFNSLVAHERCADRLVEELDAADRADNRRVSEVGAG